MLDSRILRVKKRFQMMFIGVALGLLGGIHYFLWVRLVRDPQWPTPWSGLLAWFLVLAAVGVPAVLFLSRGRTNTVAGQVVIWPAYTWLGVMFLLFAAVVTFDVARVLVAIARRITANAVVDAERRTFIARIAATAIAVVVTGATAVAVRSARRPAEVRRVRVRLARCRARRTE